MKMPAAERAALDRFARSLGLPALTKDCDRILRRRRSAS
jgi:hypothetical protein